MKKTKLLVPIDFSEVSGFLLTWAKGFAKKLSAELILVYVIEDFSSYEGLYSSVKTIENLERILQSEAQKNLEELKEKHLSDFSDVTTLITKGGVVEKIIELAQDYEAEFIILATHARKGLDKIIFGSVAEGVIKNSPIPVISINPYKMSKNL